MNITEQSSHVENSGILVPAVDEIATESDANCIDRITGWRSGVWTIPDSCILIDLDNVQIDANYGGIQMNDASTIAIANALRHHPRVRYVRLGPLIGDAGAAALGELLAVNNVIQELDLDTNLGITSVGATALAAGLKNNTGLLSFDIGYDAIFTIQIKLFFGFTRAKRELVRTGFLFIPSSGQLAEDAKDFACDQPLH
jgi:hypothetical protein